MKSPLTPLALVALLPLACAQEAAAPAGPAKPAAAAGTTAATPAPASEAAPATRAIPKAPGEKSVVDIAVGSPDHTTLVTAIKAADLVVPLNSPGGAYTVFAPTNAAFEKLPPGTVEGLLKPEKKKDLKMILQHHAMVPVLETQNMTDGQTLTMADGKKITLHVKDGKVMADNANVLASVRGMNGIVHVVDAVILPAN